MDGPPGWYGKLPTVGDFASRRLPSPFIEAWDQWLSEGLAGWRDRDPGWVDAYLAAPLWSFVIAPRVLADGMGAIPGRPAWAGVLMPSVDRVGRYYPLTVAGPVYVQHGIPARRLMHWLKQAARTAGFALHQDWTADRFDEALLELGDLTWPTLQPDDVAAAPMADALKQVLRRGDAVLWWQPLAEHEASPVATIGLPTGADFVRLISGQVGGQTASALTFLD